MDRGRVGAAAAGIGGLVWVVKAAIVLVTARDTLVGLDLGGLFVTVQALFGVALVGLHHRLLELGARSARRDLPPWIPGQGREGPRAAIGLRLAVLAVVLGVVHLGAWLLGAQATAVGAVAGLFAGIAWVAAAALLGTSALRRAALPPPAHALPLAIAVATVVLFVTFGLVSNFHGARWLEVPVALVGAAWVVLGAALWSRPVTPQLGSPDAV